LPPESQGYVKWVVDELAAKPGAKASRARKIT
jgi:hypothetical protein